MQMSYGMNVLYSLGVAAIYQNMRLNIEENQLTKMFINLAENVSLLGL